MPILERLVYGNVQGRLIPVLEDMSNIFQEIYEACFEAYHGTLVIPNDYDTKSGKPLTTSEGDIIRTPRFLFRGCFTKMVDNYIKESNGRKDYETRRSLEQHS